MVCVGVKQHSKKKLLSVFFGTNKLQSVGEDQSSGDV